MRDPFDVSGPGRPTLPVKCGIDIVHVSSDFVLAVGIAAAQIGERNGLEPQTHAGSLLFALLDIITARSIVAYHRALQPDVDTNAAIERFIDDHTKTVRAMYRALIADSAVPEGTTKQ
jgi:hypothetical protein